MGEGGWAGVGAEASTTAFRWALDHHVPFHSSNMYTNQHREGVPPQLSAPHNLFYTHMYTSFLILPFLLLTCLYYGAMVLALFCQFVRECGVRATKSLGPHAFHSPFTRQAHR